MNEPVNKFKITIIYNEYIEQASKVITIKVPNSSSLTL